MQVGRQRAPQLGEARVAAVDVAQHPGAGDSSYIRITDQPPLETTDICYPPPSGVGTCPGDTLLLVTAQTPLKGQNQAHR